MRLPIFNLERGHTGAYFLNFPITPRVAITTQRPEAGGPEGYAGLGWIWIITSLKWCNSFMLTSWEAHIGDTHLLPV
jgi:hypothetical protein